MVRDPSPDPLAADAVGGIYGPVFDEVLASSTKSEIGGDRLKDIEKLVGPFPDAPSF